MILVTGGTGLIGGEVLRLLSKDGVAARALATLTKMPPRTQYLVFFAYGLPAVQMPLRSCGWVRAKVV
jgi:nucleoside-diphosphate-sugar epimerase